MPDVRNPLPPADHDFVRRLEEARAAQYAYRARAVAEISGNPWGMRAARFGHGTALIWPGLDVVIGLRAEDAEVLDDVIGFYAAAGLRPSFDVLPLLADEPLLPLLTARGFAAVASQSVLCAAAVPRAGPPRQGVTVREVAADGLEEFAELYRVAHGWEYEDDWPQWKERLVHQYGGARWRRFVADLDGVPAGVGVLHVGGAGVAYCTNAATAPAARRRGLHGELLRERLHAAAAAGAEVVVADCRPYSASQRNLERAGFRLVYQKTRWSAPTEE